MNIIIFSIQADDITNSSLEGCHVSDVRTTENDGIEFNASRFGVNVIGYCDYKENVKHTSHLRLPLMSVEEVTNYQFDYIILNKTEETITRKLFNSIGVGDDKIKSFTTQRDECISLFMQGTSVCLRKHDIENQSQISTSECFHVKRLVSEKIASLDEYQDGHERVVYEVYKAYIDAKQLIEEQNNDKQVGENWLTFLKKTRPDFYGAIKSNNLLKLGELLSGFYRNEMSTGILGGEPGFKLFTNDENFIAPFRNLFNTWKNCVKETDLSKVECPRLGNPYGVLVDGHIIHPNNFLNHYRAEFSNNLLSECNKAVIVEVGGGYGGYANALLKSEFKGVYLNFDLPENLIVASYFLKLLYPQKKILLYDETIKQIDSSLLNLYDVVLMPHFMIEQMEELTADLCINTISFSEMDYENIEYYVEHFSRLSKRYIYHENMLDGGAGYKFFSESTFPDFKGFRKLFSVPSRWSWFNLTSAMHHHGEFLLERVKQKGE